MTIIRTASIVFNDNTTTVSNPSVTRPGAVQVGDPQILVCASPSNTRPMSITGWTALQASTNQGTLSYAIFGRVYQSGDSSTITVLTPTNADFYLLMYVPFDGAQVSAIDVFGSVGTKPGSQLTIPVPSATSSASSEPICILAVEKSSASGTTVSGIAPATVTADGFKETTGVSGLSMYVGEYTSSGTSLAAQTITYSGGAASANGIGVQVAMTAVSSGSSATVAMASASSMSVTGVVPMLVLARLGIPDVDTIRVTALTTGTTSVRLAVTIGGTTTFSGSVAPDAQGYVPLAVSGLAAGTAYTYQIELNGTLVGSPVPASTLHAPGTAAAASIAFGSCVAVLGSGPSTANPTVFDSIRNRPSITGRTGPESFWHLGDISYPNNASSPNGDYITDSTTVIRANLEAGLNGSHIAALTAAVPIGHTFSDNDSGGGNCDAGSGAWPALSNGTSVTVTQQVLPYPALPDPAALYFSYMDGRTLVITIDDRTYSSGATTTDNSSKTKLGTTQRTWLLGLLAGASAAGAAGIVILGDDDWLDAGGTSPSGDAGLPAQNDGWGAYGTERTTIGNAIAACGVKTLYCCGDTHSIALDNGANNSHGGFATFVAAPFSNTASAITRTASNGDYPSTQQTGQMYYGWLDITDDGTTWTCTCTAYDASSSAGVYTSDVVRGTPMVLTSTTSIVGMVSGSTMGVAGAAPRTATVALTSTSTVGVTGSVTQTSGVSMASTSNTGVTGQVSRSASVAVASTSTLTVTGTVTQSTPVNMSSVSTMLVSGSGLASSPVTITSTSTLGVSGKLTYLATVGMNSASSLGITGVAQRSTPVAVASVSSLTVTGSTGTTGQVGIASTSVLTVAGVTSIFSTVAMRSDTVMSVSFAAPPVTPDERVYHVPSENRVYGVPSETRTLQA